MLSGMTSVERFKRFEPEAFDFFRRLARNNNREWFARNRRFYEEKLQAPMRALVYTIAEELAGTGLPLEPNPKTPVYRIYRDLRFARDKRPYFTFLSAVLYRNGNKTQPGVMYLHFAAEELFAAIGFWQPGSAFLTGWRTRMAGQPGEFREVLRKMQRAGFEIELTDSLKRIPRGFEAQAESPLSPYFSLKSFVVRRDITRKERHSAKLPVTLAKFAVQVRGLLEFGWEIPLPKASRKGMDGFQGSG
jgi:uncharacterized protein (TIGR02453 family)